MEDLVEVLVEVMVATVVSEEYVTVGLVMVECTEYGQQCIGHSFFSGDQTKTIKIPILLAVLHHLLAVRLVLLLVEHPVAPLVEHQVVLPVVPLVRHPVEHLVDDK